MDKEYEKHRLEKKESDKKYSRNRKSYSSEDSFFEKDSHKFKDL